MAYAAVVLLTLLALAAPAGAQTAGQQPLEIPGSPLALGIEAFDERASGGADQLSLGAGLVYTYTKPKRDDIADAWYLTAIDFDNGKTRWRALGGTGFGFNNNFAPVSIGPDGAAYVGVLGGLVRLADAG